MTDMSSNDTQSAVTGQPAAADPSPEYVVYQSVPAPVPSWILDGSLSEPRANTWFTERIEWW